MLANECEVGASELIEWMLLASSDDVAAGESDFVVLTSGSADDEVAE